LLYCIGVFVGEFVVVVVVVVVVVASILPSLATPVLWANYKSKLQVKLQF
jgi:hypothetical protein